MPRRKKSECEEKSTVIKIRDDFDWGRILYDACHVFNRRMAEYLVEYAKRYDAGEVVVKNANEEISALVEKRNRLISEKKVLHDALRNASASKVSAYRKYAKALPIGEVVANFRKSVLSGETRGESIDKYRELINGRSELNNAYHSCLIGEKKAMENERRHIDANLFATRSLSHKINNIAKMIDKHKVQLDHPMADDVDSIYNLLMSEAQNERLMAVCLNILNTYSEKEFGTMMNVLERERIAEKIFEFFSKFEHNYDFICGCYDVDESTGLLKMKPLDVLANKIYNGYYFTIRGFVQRSYAGIRFEKFNMENTDANWKIETDNGNHGIDKKISNESEMERGGIPVSHEPESLDEGMIDIWTDCNNYLSDSIPSMSQEISDELFHRFPKNPYYSNSSLSEKMSEVMTSVMNKVNGELISGNVVGNKLKHIVLDSMGGAETNEEWRQNVVVITKTLMKYIRKFFMKENMRHVDENNEYVYGGVEDDQ